MNVLIVSIFFQIDGDVVVFVANEENQARKQQPDENIRIDEVSV